MGKYTKQLITILIIVGIFYLGFTVYQKIKSSQYQYYKGEIRKTPNYMKAKPENAPNYYKGSLEKAPNYKKAKMKDNPYYIKSKKSQSGSKKPNRREEMLRGIKENW